MHPLIQDIISAIIKIGTVFLAISLVVAYLVYFERKIIGHLQVRMGPMRVGWHGLLQPIADGLKLFLKEDIIPEKADRWVFMLAPIFCLVPAFIVYSVVPFDKNFLIANINIGILYIVSISSLGVYGIVLAGWASNSKYALLGGFRSAAQMISYEIFLGFSIIGPLMLAGSLNATHIIEAQIGTWLGFIPRWFIFTQPLAFILYLIAGIAETNRIPFDLPEAETELVAGFHTEYSGMKFAFFFLAEYANMIVVSAMAVILFLGGWQGPLLPGVFWFAIKISLFIFLFFWLRATLPRYRYDQLMDIGWKLMFPLALLNIAVTGIVYYFFL